MRIVSTKQRELQTEGFKTWPLALSLSKNKLKPPPTFFYRKQKKAAGLILASIIEGKPPKIPSSSMFFVILGRNYGQRLLLKNFIAP